MRIGFIGTGRMGAPMALNLIRAGHDLVVHDLNRSAAEPVLAAGALWADSPAAVAREATVIFGSLPTPAAMEDVTVGEGGIRDGAAPGTIFIDLTTNSPTLVRRVAAILVRSGIDLIDAPVSGGVVGARAGTLAVMVGGDRALFEKHRPLLEAIGQNVFHLGPLGSGNVAKLVNNAMSFSQRAILAEGLMIGARAGLRPEVLIEVIRSSSGNSVAINRLLRTLESGDFTPNFTIDLACKDVGLAVQLARENGVPYRFAALTEQLLIGLQAEGRGSEDTNHLLGRLERITGQTVRFSQSPPPAAAGPTGTTMDEVRTANEKAITQLDQTVGEAVTYFRTKLEAESAEWGPKEVLSHLLYWHGWSVGSLEAVTAGQAPHVMPPAPAEIDAINARAVADRRDREMASLTTELATLQHRLIQLARNLPDPTAIVAIRSNGQALTVAERLELMRHHIGNHLAELRGSA